MPVYSSNAWQEYYILNAKWIREKQFKINDKSNTVVLVYVLKLCQLHNVRKGPIIWSCFIKSDISIIAYWYPIARWSHYWFSDIGHVGPAFGYNGKISKFYLSTQEALMVSCKTCFLVILVAEQIICVQMLVTWKRANQKFEWNREVNGRLYRYMCPKGTGVQWEICWIC